ncbi:hypothetical protein [Petrachloros mirabilis]
MSAEALVEFTTDELCLLLGLFGPCISFGVPNPYLGKFADEIETAQTVARDSLLGRDVIRLINEREVALDEVIAKILQTCAHPAHTAIVTAQISRTARQMLYIHFTPDLVVEHAVVELNRHQLIPYSGHVAIVERLSYLLHLNGQKAAKGEGFTVDEKLLLDVRSSVAKKGNKKIQGTLVEAGLNVEQADMLVRALGNPIANSSVVVLVNREDGEKQHVTGFGMLESALGTWLLLLKNGVGTPRVEFIPSTAREIQTRLDTLLP